MKKIILFVSLLISTQVCTAQKVNVGDKAPEIAFANPAGKVIKLSAVNKKTIVLIDFWASWCGPCRRGNPAAVALYNKYTKAKFKNAKKGFTIFSVSLDQDKARWEAAIAQDGLLWKNHVSDLKGWSCEPAAAYGVTYIPQLFLIDENGMIIGHYMQAEQAEAELQKRLK